MTDGRRRQYVPVSVDVARSRTGRRLLERFGPDGLLVWILVLAAAKKGFNQGEFEYVSEADGWERLGLTGFDFDFTLKEFFDYTGRLHNTKRNGNDAQTVRIRAWNEWNTSLKREMDATRKSRSRSTFTRTNQRTEVDLDLESEREAVAHKKEENQKAAELFLAEMKRRTAGDR